jgi:uncharacterized membrane protein YkvA (DUF1232 family)
LLDRWARNIKRDVVAVWIAARDPRVPWYAKAIAAVVVVYAFSPIDLIPDFIPVLGYLDDLLIVPLSILLAVKLIPVPLMHEFREKAAREIDRPKSYVGIVAVVVVWAGAAAWLVWVFWPKSDV